MRGWFTAVRRRIPRQRAAPPEVRSEHARAAEAAAARAARAQALASWTWRHERRALLEIVALCGLLVAQPVLHAVGASPGFLLFHGVSGASVALLVALVVAGPPLLLWALAAASRLAGAKVRHRVQVATIAVLVALLVVQWSKPYTGPAGLYLLAFAALMTLLAIVAYLRLDVVRQGLRFAAAGPLAFVLLFVFASPASAVMLPGDAPVGADDARAIGPHPPMVVVLFDELPLVSLLDDSGQIDADRFPHFARLAGESTWYRNATAAAGWTPHAMPAMLTGRWPQRDVAAHYREYPDNLFTLLGGVYQVQVVETISHLCPPWHCEQRIAGAYGGLPTALADLAQMVRQGVSPWTEKPRATDGFQEPTVTDLGPRFLFEQARAENRPARFLDFLEWLQPQPLAEADAPTLHFLHLLMPHSPWVHLPSGLQYEAPPLPIDGDPWWSQLAHQRYLAQLQYTDRLLGEVLDALEAAGVYDEAVVVVTSDHGHSFQPGMAGRRLADDDANAAELAWVPLFIKEPGQTAGVVEDGNWQHVDLLPTLADFAGVAVPWTVDGLSWLRGSRDTSQKVYYEYEDVTDRRVFDGAPLFADVISGRAGPSAPPLLPELVGQQVTELPVGGQRAGLAQVPALAAFEQVEPSSGVVPALVHGTVSANFSEGTPIAIGVNGQIAAVVPVVRQSDGSVGFAGLIPDTLLHPGANDLAVFEVQPEAGGVRLYAIPVAAR